MLLSPEDILLQQRGQASCEVFATLVQHTNLLYLFFGTALFCVWQLAYTLDHLPFIQRDVEVAWR